MDGTGFTVNDQILEGLRPNFFELLSEEAMHEALRPAFQYLTKVLVQSRPDWFSVLWRFSDEVFLVLESLLQLHFIRRHSSSFSECFYSIRRAPSSRPMDSLGKWRKVASIVCLAVIPYIKVKLDWVFSKLQEADDSIPLQWRSSRWKGRLAFLYFKTYPYIQTLWELLKLSFRLRYLFNSSVFYSPLHLLAGVSPQRSMDTDDAGGVATSRGLWHWLAGNSFPLFVFTLKFVEWWYSAEKREAVRILTVLPVPPPPDKMKPHPSGIRVPADPSLCPLCGIHRNTPTALSSSGYVYCYRCIHGYVHEHSECPVTCLPSTLQQLVRLYPHQQ